MDIDPPWPVPAIPKDFHREIFKSEFFIQIKEGKKIWKQLSTIFEVFPFLTFLCLSKHDYRWKPSGSLFSSSNNNTNNKKNKKFKFSEYALQAQGNKVKYTNLEIQTQIN